MSRRVSPEQQAWLAERGMELADEEYGHWIERGASKRVDNGHRDLTQTEDGKWFAMFFHAGTSSSSWESREFGTPQAAWVSAELENWGQP